MKKQTVNDFLQIMTRARVKAEGFFGFRYCNVRTEKVAEITVGCV